jgi:DNA repair exonuclease SbcCD ATPase subunit
MKKYLILLLIPVLFACGRAAKKEAEAMKAKNDSLMAQTMQKDEAINEFIATVNDIQGTLDTIKMKENIINLSTNKNGELKLLMEKNKKELSDLTRKLKASNMKVTELQKLVDRLQKDVTDRNVEIEALRDKLARLNIVIETANLRLDTLSNVVKSQQQTLAQQEAALNTAYYIVGTEKDLKKNGVIGKGDKLLSDFNKALFTKVDIRKLTEVSILSKKAKVISNHPTSSYKLVGDKKIVQSLQITDYKAFWSNVRYLVILVN